MNCVHKVNWFATSNSTFSLFPMLKSPFFQSPSVYRTYLPIHSNAAATNTMQYCRAAKTVYHFYLGL